nr:ribonuclease H-like domain, reverse transcriptase, RNA-dependent DNA polymerase [Tanacetum cinerariifolium]GEY69176.1 ribonuclease H-like domain, reverse transcriptase, RNA-dependent DNA polymerase [Tanacetum cinerariifolium]
MKAVKQVLRYVKGTKDYGITYKHNGGNIIQGFNNSSYGVNTQKGKGPAGIIFYYGDSPISWSTQKQATVALSSCESEFIAATTAATQALCEVYIRASSKGQPFAIREVRASNIGQLVKITGKNSRVSRTCSQRSYSPYNDCLLPRRTYQKGSTRYELKGDKEEQIARLAEDGDIYRPASQEAGGLLEANRAAGRPCLVALCS